MEGILKIFDLTLQDGWMILVGAAIFFSFWKILDKSVIGPFLALIETRERLTGGALSSAQDATTQAAELNAKFDQRIFDARADAMKEKILAVGAAKSEAAKLLSNAEDSVQEVLRNQRWEIQQNLDTLRRGVLKDADAIAQSVVDKVTSPSR